VPTSPQTALAFIGTLAGLVYAALGIAALKYRTGADATDRAVGWSLWWFAERAQYSARGQALCRHGAVAFAVGVVCWVAWFALSRT
jgi:hypothetical protein